MKRPSNSDYAKNARKRVIRSIAEFEKKQIEAEQLKAQREFQRKQYIKETAEDAIIIEDNEDDKCMHDN